MLFNFYYVLFCHSFVDHFPKKQFTCFAYAALRELLPIPNLLKPQYFNNTLRNLAYD
jgi:hypothetical protein